MVTPTTITTTIFALMPVPDILVSREVTHQCLWNGLHQFKKEQIKNFQWEKNLPPPVDRTVSGTTSLPFSPQRPWE